MKIHCLKNVLLLILLVSYGFLFAQPASGLQAELTNKNSFESAIFGKWEVVSSRLNGRPAPERYEERILEIREDGTFETRVKTNGNSRRYNSGKFFLPDTQSIVTVHVNQQQDLIEVANFYHFRIQSDTLYLAGNFYRKVEVNNILIGTALEETLVRVE